MQLASLVVAAANTDAYFARRSPDLGVGSAVTAVRKRAASTVSSTAPLGVVDLVADEEEAKKKKEAIAANNARILEKQMLELAKLKEKVRSGDYLTAFASITPL